MSLYLTAFSGQLPEGQSSKLSLSTSMILLKFSLIKAFRSSYGTQTNIHNGHMVLLNFAGVLNTYTCMFVLTYMYLYHYSPQS